MKNSISDWKIDPKKPTEIYVERTKIVKERVFIAQFNYPEDAEKALKAMRRGKSC